MDERRIQFLIDQAIKHDLKIVSKPTSCDWLIEVVLQYKGKAISNQVIRVS